MSNQTTKATRILRGLLVVAAVVGLVFSIHYNRTLAQLRQQYGDLSIEVGGLEISDPTKVAISYVPTSDELIPPGVAQAYVWRYRMYIPAGYGDCTNFRSGLITADSPQGKGGGGTSGNSPDPEPRERVVTLALIKNDGQWQFSRTSGGTSSSSSLSSSWKFDSLEDLVVETPVSADDPRRVFDSNDAICLVRLRKKELAKKRNGQEEENLYRGFSTYMYSSERKDAFKAWASGEVDSMDEVE